MKQIKMDSGWRVAVFLSLFWLPPSIRVASAQSKVNIVHPGAATWSLLLSVAQEQGLFAKHGIDVQLVSVTETEVPRLTGENPFGCIGAPAALLRAAGGTDLKILGFFNTGRLSSHVVARNDIKKPDELRGKRFGVRALGAGIWIETILALEHLGLDPKRDNISILSVGDRSELGRALETGTIDAAVLSPAQSHRLRAKGFSVLVDLYPAKIYAFQTALVVTAAYLQQHPDVVEKVVNALVEAMAFSFAPGNKSRVVRTIMKLKLFNATDVASAERSYKDLADLNNSKPYPSIERLRNMQRVIGLHDPKVLNLRAEDLIEDHFVRKLDKTGVIDRLYATYGVK
jgi:ABC-type nitrate/sulfonate/bicarbonate transport system substrate-binding protein